MFRALKLCTLALLTPLLACQGGGQDGPNVDCSMITAPKFAEMTAWAKCTSCHASTLTGSARAGAPVGIDFDVYDAAVAHAQVAMDEVYMGAMPVAGSPPLSDAEKQQIYEWASCDTPK